MEHLLGFAVIVILYAAIGFMAVAGVTFMARKFLAPKAEQIFFALFLIMIAGFYLAFAAYFGAATAWRLETGVVVAFAAIGIAGVRLPLALIIGYALHGLWDVLHDCRECSGANVCCSFADASANCSPSAESSEYGSCWRPSQYRLHLNSGECAGYYRRHGPRANPLHDETPT
jgi:hypothetical protein